MPLPGSSNITFSSRFGAPPNAAPSTAPGGLNLGPPPGSGGALVKFEPQSQALIPKAKPSLAAYESPRFAEPVRVSQDLFLTQQPTINPRPVPNLADIPKPVPNLQSTPLTIPKNTPVTGIVSKSGVVEIASRGGLTGALVAVAAEVLIHDAKELYKLYKLSQPEPKFEPRPFSTPASGILYGFTTSSPFFNTQSPSGITSKNLVGVVKAPIQSRSEVGKFGGPHWYVEVVSADYPNGIRVEVGIESEPAPTLGPWERTDGQSDTTPTPVTPPSRSPVPLRQASPQAADSPGGLPQFLPPPEPRRKLDLVPNLAPPPADKPLESNKKIPITITTPGAGPITISAPGQAPVTINPSGNPTTIKITRPAAIPTSTAPSSIPGSTPTSTPAPVPISVSSPGSTPTTLTMPGTGAITINAPGQQPITFDPTTGKPTGVQSNPNQKPSAYVSTPDPATPTTPATTPTNPLTTVVPKNLPEIGLALVGITQLLQGIAPKVTPTAIANAVCETTKPNGCTTNAINKGVSTGNEDLKQYLTKQLPNIIGDTANAALGADTNARVKNIENRTGSHRYPMTLPEYLLDDFIDKPVIIQDQVDFNVWLVKNVDALVGLFPIKIERTDEDGVKQMLKYENIAEAIAEVTGLLSQIAFDADTAVNVATRATGEAIGAKAAALQAGSYLKAIVDYMGFQGEPVSFDVPISVTPGAVGFDGKLQENELKDFLKPSIQKAIGFKNTDPIDQRLTQRRLIENTEITRASVYRPLKSDATKNLLTGDAISADKKAEKKRVDDLWDAFKLRMEGHTAGTKVDIDDGTKPSDTTP